jgi:hypothetical protein
MRAGAHHRPSVRLSIPTTSAFSADLCLAPSRVYFTSAALGGEHTITLALLRALAKKRGPVGLVFFDAHVDTWKEKFGRRTFQIGIRSPVQKDVFYGSRAIDPLLLFAVRHSRRGASTPPIV